MLQAIDAGMVTAPGDWIRCGVATAKAQLEFASRRCSEMIAIPGATREAADDAGRPSKRNGAFEVLTTVSISWPYEDNSSFCRIVFTLIASTSTDRREIIGRPRVL